MQVVPAAIYKVINPTIQPKVALACTYLALEAVRPSKLGGAQAEGLSSMRDIRISINAIAGGSLELR